MTIVFGSGVYGGGPWGGAGALTPAAGVLPLSKHFCTWALAPGTDDIAIPMRLLRGEAAIEQRIRSRIRFFAGEWFLDTRLGVPYFNQILIKNPKLPVIGAIFRKVLTSTPGVATCSNVTVRVDRRLRIGYIGFDASLDDGLTLTAHDEPFIIGQRRTASVAVPRV